jgi:hypothetical protein
MRIVADEGKQHGFRLFGILLFGQMPGLKDLGPE